MSEGLQATPAEAESDAQRLLPALLDAVDPERPAAIFTHDHPDPDSIASAYALQYLLARRLDLDPAIGFGGIIGRTTNRAMVELLGIHLDPLTRVLRQEFGTHCLIDTQPGTGNVSLPADLRIDIAIDHHPQRPATSAVTFADVRTSFGSTSTIMYYYLHAAGLDLPTKLATALLIGIKSDTRGLEREASDADLHAYLEIFPRADLNLVQRIENPRIPRRYYEAFHRALRLSMLHNGAIITDLGDVDTPDMVAELADFFSPLESAHYALVMGRHKGRLYLSLRTRDDEHDAGMLISEIVGELGTAGGHGKMAGGQIDLQGDPEASARAVRERFLEVLERDPGESGESLVRES